MTSCRLIFYLFIFTVALVQGSEAESGQEDKAKKPLNGSRQCPRQCTCEIAPLRTASFVATWMTSWGEDDLPNIHPNDILNANLMINSMTANDASVDVDVVGLHVTCSLHPTTVVSTLLEQIPKDSMVLNILQAPGCNLTIIDGGQFAGLSELKALHLQGYAHKHREQVSGYKPNSVSEMIEHKKLLDQELQKVEGKETRELQLALAEDALQPLHKLQLLDLQFVRLVASKEERRSRRYSSEPVSTMTLLDLPFDEFVRFVDHADSLELPDHLRELLEDFSQEIEDDSFSSANDIHSYIVQKDVFTESDNPPGPQTIRQNLHLLGDERKEKVINSLREKSVIVPYEIYKDGLVPILAPFKSQQELKYLRVAHARLDRVGSELLEGLHLLHTLTLEYNNIKVLPDGLFSSTPGLRHLSLAHNNIFALESGSLEGLGKLLTLDLDFNNISVLGSSSFPSLPSLLTLRGVGNPISHLLPDAFRSLNSTENMFLGSPNSSMDVHQNSFRFLDSLQTLELKNVTETSLQKKIFIGMIHLKELTVHGIIPEISYDAFSYTPFLLKLNISFCSIHRLSIDSFYGLNLLLKLDLSHNRLSSISPGLFLPVPVKLLQLHNNPWNCTCDLLQLSPSVTNKVVKEGNIQCEWTEKLATVCQKGGEKLVYDARVAPLCYEPPSLKGFDVYHAALRHLECNNYHWDPSLLYKFMPEDVTTDNSEAQLLPKKDDVEESENPKTSQNYLPLMDFTPEPFAKDLLDIAENEGLEEVIEDPEVKSSETEVTTTTKKMTNIAKEQHMNDQPVNKYPQFRHNSHALKYYYQKKKLKKVMKTNEQKRLAAKKAYMANVKKMSLAQKKKIKAMLQQKQKKMHQLRKLEWKKKLNYFPINNSLA